MHEPILDLRREDGKIVITRVSISVLQRIGYSSENVTRVRMYTHIALNTRLLSIQLLATRCVVSLDTQSRESVYFRVTRE